MNLTKKIVKFVQNMTCEYIFNNLKKQFTTTLILTHFDPNLECVLETNLSDHAQEDVLS